MVNLQLLKTILVKISFLLNKDKKLSVQKYIMKLWGEQFFEISFFMNNSNNNDDFV